VPITRATCDDPRGVGPYELGFDIDGYYATTGNVPMFPRVLLHLRIAEAAEDLHIPLLVAPHLLLSHRGSSRPDVF
jgi:5-hydroxyisourate hydrolase-like protein (transthyretin family)